MAMKDYFQFLVFMLPTALVIGLASATVASAGAKLESPSFQLPHVQSEANRLESTNG
jgi:hypothetical protein